MDNARETVRNNEILGIVQPHASRKVTVAMAALSGANPIAGYTLRCLQMVYGLSICREILFPAGTVMQEISQGERTVAPLLPTYGTAV